MAVTLASLLTNPYKIAVPNYMNVRAHPAAATHTGAVIYRNEHIHYPTATVRGLAIPRAPSHTEPQYQIGGMYLPNGNTYFLPYDNNIITSMRLPTPAPAGVNLFVTANMSGCRFFVDTITGSNDLMVYHANTQQHGSPALADCDFQSVNASNVLDQMVVDARTDLAPLALVAAASCVKATYFGPGGVQERALAFAGHEFEDMKSPHRPRNIPTFSGGCAIVGLVVGGAWQFWYQCWGTVNYKVADQIVTRKIIPDKRIKGAVHMHPCAVLGTGQIY